MADLLPDKVRTKILAKITPTQAEVSTQSRIIKDLIDSLKEYVVKTEFQFSFIEPEGSTGKKQTQLRGVADIDLFVALNPRDYPEIFSKTERINRQAIDKLMNNLVSNWFEPAVKDLHAKNVQRAFSQHPFLSLKMNGIDIDILGCFDIDATTLAENGPITAVDRTVHHTSYIAERMTPRKRENVRILKSFVRACHAYGDTCAVGRMGLTGVALEILALNNPDLDSTFRALQELDTNPVDPESRSLSELRKISAFRDDYIFLIDPTDHQRNMASSFSSRAYSWIQYKIDELRKHIVSEDILRVEKILLEEPIPSSEINTQVKKHGIVKEFESNNQVHYTILRDKLYRLARKVTSKMSQERTGEPRFGEILSEVYFKNSRFALGILVEYPIISHSYQRKGPSTTLREAAKNFKETHPGKVFESEGFLYVKEERVWKVAAKMFESLLRNNPIKGLEIQDRKTKLSNQVLHVLSEYILSIEPEFRERITRVKEKEKNLQM